MRNKLFTTNAWKDYLSWEKESPKTLKRVNDLIEDICRNGYTGIGKPESLAGDLTGYWSRRINQEDRIVYKVDDENAYFLACKSHYRRK